MADTNDFAQNGPGTIVLQAGFNRYLIGPNGITLERGRLRKHLGWNDILVVQRLVSPRVGNIRLEFVARHTPPRWLPLVVIAHVPLGWLTDVLTLDPKACGMSDAQVIAIVRSFAPDIRIDTLYRGRTIAGDLDGPDIVASGNAGGGGDSGGGSGD